MVSETIPFEGPTSEIGAVDSPDDGFEISEGISENAAWKMLIYGTPGIGKSSVATFAPDPFFLDLENGLKRINCKKTKRRLVTLSEVYDWLRYIWNKPYKTIVIDTLDELEKLLSAKVIEDWNRDAKTKAKTVADIPFGRGGDLLVAEWRRLIEIFDSIVISGKNVLLIGHEKVEQFDNPSDANFNYWTVNLHKKTAPVVTAKLDAVLFARYETFVQNVSDGKGNQPAKGKAVGTGQRVLHTQQGAAWTGKNRFGLEPVVPLDGSLFQLIK